MTYSELNPQAMTTLTLAGGCFWCIEAVFRQTRGVLDCEVGYAGGHTAAPSYLEVCQGQSGHAEVVSMRYDANIITLTNLLEIFFLIHDPTSLNRQGNDIGTQYRSAIYYHDAEQKTHIEAFISTQQKLFTAPIVTEVAALNNYHKAELKHQNYYANNAAEGYCQFVITPKLAKFRKTFQQFVCNDSGV